MQAKTKRVICCMLLWLCWACVGVIAEKVGQTRVRLDTLNADKQETTFGYLAADALRAVSNSDIALISASAFAPGSINPGDISSEQIANLFDYPDEKVVVADLTGEIIRNMLEHALGFFPSPSNGFLHVSGLKITFDRSKKRPEPRITRVEMISGSATQPLDPGRTYRVATTSTIVRGALGYFKIIGANPKYTRLDGLTVAGAVLKYLKSSGPVEYGNERRISG